MKIYLVDKNEKLIIQWKKAFGYVSDVEVVTDTVSNFIANNKNIDGIVVTTDSKYDVEKEISDMYGEDLYQKISYAYKINNNHYMYGECLPVIYEDKPSLFLANLKDEEGKVDDSDLINNCMLSALYNANELGIENIVVTSFGDETNGIHTFVMAREMYDAYEYFKEYQVDYSYVEDEKVRFLVEEYRSNKELREKNYKIIKNAIDNVDIENLFDLGCPDDEYDIEAKLIEDKLNPYMSEENMFNIIKCIFDSQFSADFKEDDIQRIVDGIYGVLEK